MTSQPTVTRRGVLRVVVMGCLLLVSRGVAAQSVNDDVTDIVLLIDVSASMPLGDSTDIGRREMRLKGFRDWMNEQWSINSRLEKLSEADFKELVNKEAEREWESDWFQDYRNVKFQEFKSKLQNFIRTGLNPDSRVTLITFGEEVTKGETAQIGDRAQRQRLLEAMAALKAQAVRTYICKALFQAQEEVARLKKQEDEARAQNPRLPQHHRHVVLLTDGVDNPPVVNYAWQKTAELKEDRKSKGIQCGKDFFLWYAHIGPPDPKLKGAIAELSGQSMEIDDLRFGQFWPSRRVLKLPSQQSPSRLPGGTWRVEYPALSAWNAGERLSIQHHNCEGMEVQVGPIEVEQIAPWCKGELCYRSSCAGYRRATL